MNFRTVFRNNNTSSDKSDTKSDCRPNIPHGLYRKCNTCGSAILAEDVRNSYYICPKCGACFRIPARKRLELIADNGSFCEWNKDLTADNPMNFHGYEEKLRLYQQKTHLTEAVITGSAKINGADVVLGICDGNFWMASMGWAVGEKLTRAIEQATAKQLPVILFCCSGGARMQEGITSLMQMAKTSAAIKKHSDAGLLSITILTDPTTGGVTASFAMLGDIILAEPNALIGFAGPRVIEQTIQQKLPDGFQRAEFLLEHGFIDHIVTREQMKSVLSQLLMLHKKPAPISDSNDHTDISLLTTQPLPELTAWERVVHSRKIDRPVGIHYIESLFDSFIELHGDRLSGEDPAILGGIAFFHGQPVTVIAQSKGRTTKENVRQNFGMPSPEGYRKALRLMRQAEKFNRPILCFVDTPGAFCGMEAEERGQGEAIARNLFEMSSFSVPLLSIIIGEGGSGGALALAVSDEVWMLENSVYSILSPEGFASILWKNSKRAKEAAAIMQLSAEALFKKGIIEQIIPEPDDYSSSNCHTVMERLEEEITAFLRRQRLVSSQERIQKRYERFRNM